jgi:hypothetical protein
MDVVVVLARKYLAPPLPLKSRARRHPAGQEPTATGQGSSSWLPCLHLWHLK